MYLNFFYNEYIIICIIFKSYILSDTVFSNDGHNNISHSTFSS